MIWLRSFIIIVCMVTFLSRGAVAFDKYKVIETESGPVRGQLEKTLFDEKPYYSFKGIPYAEVPIGNLRFKAPVPKRPWTAPLYALKYGNDCLQKTMVFGVKIFGCEDCLYLNIFVPADYKPDERATVMFYIHGGGYFEGSGSDEYYGPDFLINENVILVTFNYRLAMFGFLSLGTPEYSGNMGLKDQQLALKWINANIHHFGGDNKKITVFGHSAGSASTHFQLLAEPSSQSLFQRAIPMSGSGYNTWALNGKTTHLEDCYKLAMSLNRPVENLEELKRFLINVDAIEIIENIKTGTGDMEREAILHWTPIVESGDALQPILLQNLEDIYARNWKSDIDVMFGFTSKEWLFLMGPVLNDPEALRQIDTNFDVLLPYKTFYKYYETKEYKNMILEIRNHYFGEGVAIDENTGHELATLLSDVYMVYGIDVAITIHSKVSSGNTFYYKFSVDSAFNGFKVLSNTTSQTGSSHGDELCYLFRCKRFPDMYNDVNRDSKAMRASKLLTGIFSNFAKYGNPTSQGQLVDLKPSLNDLHTLEITNDGVSIVMNPNYEMVKFWTLLHEKYEKIFREIDQKDEL